MIEDFEVGGVSLWELGQVCCVFGGMLTVIRDWIISMSCYDTSYRL